jgi:CHAT domain-containing protein
LGALLQAYEKLIVLEAARGNTVNVTVIAPSVITEQPQPDFEEIHQSDLPFAVEEVNKITGAVGENRIHMLLSKQATVDNVSTHLPTCTWLHLACHGHQDSSDPLKSCLMLYGGELELAQILNTVLPRAEFAFLSGCQTRTGDAKLENESMHLAGAMICAGFCGAIGTMWGIADWDMPKVANLVYSELFKNDRVPKVDEAAHALNVAVQTMRRHGVPLHRWLPFVHIGV